MKSSSAGSTRSCPTHHTPTHSPVGSAGSRSGSAGAVPRKAASAGTTPKRGGSAGEAGKKGVARVSSAGDPRGGTQKSSSSTSGRRVTSGDKAGRPSDVLNPRTVDPVSAEEAVNVQKQEERNSVVKPVMYLFCQFVICATHMKQVTKNYKPTGLQLK